MEKLYTVSKKNTTDSTTKGFPGRSMVKNLPANAGDKRPGFSPGQGRYPGGEHGNPL